MNFFILFCQGVRIYLDTRVFIFEWILFPLTKNPDQLTSVGIDVYITIQYCFMCLISSTTSLIKYNNFKTGIVASTVHQNWIVTTLFSHGNVFN